MEQTLLLGREAELEIVRQVAAGLHAALLLTGEPGSDNTSPLAIGRAAYEQQQKNGGVTEIAEIAGRGHALTIDHGWREVADAALAFIKRFA